MILKFFGKEEINKYIEYIEKAANDYPVQYILGYQEFMKLNFKVNENVLIPRQDTEILVEEVISLSKNDRNFSIFDLCTGSGAIAISISKSMPNIKVFAGDISKDALEVAKYNSNNLGAEVNFFETDIFKNVHQEFNIIVSNPPYIKTSVIKTLDSEVQKEPKLALDGGADGLKFYREIINNAYKYLKEEGYLCLEIGYDQKQEVLELIEKTNKYEDIYSKKDLAGLDRIVVCKKRGEK